MSLGHEEKLFFCITAEKVEMVRDKHAACRYYANSLLDCFFLMITFALWFELVLLLSISSRSSIGESFLCADFVGSLFITLVMFFLIERDERM